MKISTNFLEKYNKPAPRYTSYPPATSFNKSFTKEDYIQSLIDSNTEGPQNISIYIHIPFCPQRCFFCGCNTTAFENDEKVRKYIDSILIEIESVTKYIDKNRKVSQIHFGGGTPNSINLDLLNEIILKIKSHFSLTSNSEIAIECNPAYLEIEHIDKLAEFGFNRISLGIQDFDLHVLKTINRSPSKYPIEKIIERIRQNNFKGYNIDLVYGLPEQTIEGFKNNIEKALKLSPDRIVTFSYAHVPWFNELQKKLESFRMPDAEEKLKMLVMALNIFTQAGYEDIGMDHFAKPTDELSIAKIGKTLHRNFQGYCTKETTGQVYAFGSSSISQLFSSYIQNIKNIDLYIKSINNETFAVDRGYKLSKEEKIIREVINEVMCNGYLNFEDIAKQFNTSSAEVKQIINYNPDKLKEFINDNLLEISNDIIQVSSDGMLVVRNIAMVFDPYLKLEPSQYSKTV